MANQHTVKAKAARAAAAKRAWVTIRANQAAREKNAKANAAITPAALQATIKASERKLAGKAA